MKLKLTFVSTFLATLRRIPSTVKASLQRLLHTVKTRFQRLIPASPRKRMLFYICLGLLFVLLSGGITAWLLQRNAYRASPEYAVDMLNQALSTRDVVLFSNIVDCALFARHFTASTIAQNQKPMPEGSLLAVDQSAYQKNPDSVHFIMEKNIQDKLLFFIQGEDTVPQDNAKILLFLSPTLLGQLVNHPFVLDKSSTPFQAVSKVDFPFAPKMPLHLTLVESTKGWRIGYLENDDQLISRQHDFIKKQNDDAEEKINALRADQVKQINTLIPQPQCTASVSTISGGTHLLTYKVSSQPNAGKQTVLAWRVDMNILSAQGLSIRKSHLDQTGSLTPGMPLHDAWSVEISADDYDMFSKASPLICQPQISFISLTNGVIYRNIAF